MAQALRLGRCPVCTCTPAEVAHLRERVEGLRVKLGVVRNECRSEWIRAEKAEGEVERLRAQVSELVADRAGWQTYNSERSAFITVVQQVLKTQLSKAATWQEALYERLHYYVTAEREGTALREAVEAALRRSE
jgi:hypothetical protein